MIPKSYLSMSLAIVLPLLIAAPGRAQMFGGDGENQRQKTRLDLDFPGGTLDEYIETIRRSDRAITVNVLVMPTAKTLEIPPVALVAVTVEAAVQLLEGPYDLPNGHKAYVNIARYEIGESSNFVMRVVADFEHDELRASVWNLERTLAGGQTAEVLLGAVEVVLSVFPEKAVVSFHPPTRLLIVRGSVEQLELIDEAIHQLNDSAGYRSEEIGALKASIDELEGDLMSLIAQTVLAERSTKQAQSQLERIAALRASEAVSTDAVANAERELARTHTNMEILMDQRTRLNRKLESLREDLKKRERPQP